MSCAVVRAFLDTGGPKWINIHKTINIWKPINIEKSIDLQRNVSINNNINIEKDIGINKSSISAEAALHFLPRTRHPTPRLLFAAAVICGDAGSLPPPRSKIPV
jgi:hypothetical protein